MQRAPLPAEINKLADETLEAYEAYLARCVMSESAREEGRIDISYDEVNEMRGASACFHVLLGLTRLKLKRTLKVPRRVERIHRKKYMNDDTSVVLTRC